MSKLIQCYWPPFFVIALVCLAAVLNGCSVQSVPISGQSQADAPGFATLADANDPIDMAAAPVVSRLALYTHNATKALKAGKITKQQAIAIRENERDLRSRIERAVAARDSAAIESVSAKLAVYVKNLESMQ